MTTKDTMFHVTSPRPLGILAAGLAIPLVLVCSAPIAAADSTNDVAICHSSRDAGVEVDTCTGNPDYDVNPPGEQVRVVPEFCFGLGFGGCDDD